MPKPITSLIEKWRDAADACRGHGRDRRDDSGGAGRGDVSGRHQARYRAQSDSVICDAEQLNAETQRHKENMKCCERWQLSRRTLRLRVSALSFLWLV